MSGVVEGKLLEECVDRGQWLAALGLKELGPSYVNFSSSLHPYITFRILWLQQLSPASRC